MGNYPPRYPSGFIIKPRDLSARRLDVLKAFAHFTEERDYAPSVRELGEELKLKSPSSVLGHLENLERDGYLSRLRRTVRPWQLTRLAKNVLNAA